MGPFWGMGLGSPSNKLVQQTPTGEGWADYMRKNHAGARGPSMGGMFPQVKDAIGNFMQGNVGSLTPPQQPSPFDQTFGQFPGFKPSASPTSAQGGDAGLIPKFIEMMKNRAATDAGAPKTAAAPAMGGTGVPSQAEMDASTARWAGTPENNPLLRPMGSNNSGQRLPWQNTPFAGMLDSAYQAGGQPDAGLIPKFVNMMGNM